METDQNKAVVLIVDDMAANRNVLNDLTLTLGYEPVQARDGEEALRLVAERPVDLILLDIMMPGMDGCETLAQLKADERFAHIPVIMVTALDDLSTTALCIQKGADDYLTKPFDAVLLRARILSSLKKKQARDREMTLYAELQTAYDNLRKTESARDALAHMIVHDINNPLTVVSATCSLTRQMLEMGETDPDMLRESFSNIYEATQDMMRLTRNILAVAQMEAGEMRANLEPVNVRELAEQLCRQYQSQAELQHIKLSFQASPDDVWAKADKTLLRRMLQNLITNALKHTQEGVRVTVTLTGQDGQCVVAVADNGPGIREQDIKRIFDKFYQASIRREGRRYGVGLGLTFCKMAAEVQQGEIAIESAEGQGATFRITLPLAHP